MTQLTTWDNRPRELWVGNGKGVLVKKFIVFYNVLDGYGLDKQGNRYGVVYEPTEFKDCKSFDELKSELVHTYDKRKIDLNSILNIVEEWFKDSYLPKFKEQIEFNALSPVKVELHKLYRNYDVSDLQNNRFRFSPQEQFLAKEFCSNISSILGKLGKE